MIRWVWTGPGNEEFGNALSDFRPSDRESLLEMMQGRYLLASKLVDTNGASPFAIDMVHDDWLDDLQSFCLAPAFPRCAHGRGARVSPRALVIDWIDRDGGFDPRIWGLSLTARRVLNWLRHFNILVEGANPEDAADHHALAGHADPVAEAARAASPKIRWMR